MAPRFTAAPGHAGDALQACSRSLRGSTRATPPTNREVRTVSAPRCGGQGSRSGDFGTSAHRVGLHDDVQQWVSSRAPRGDADGTTRRCPQVATCGSMLRHPPGEGQAVDSVGVAVVWILGKGCTPCPDAAMHGLLRKSRHRRHEDSQDLDSFVASATWESEDESLRAFVPWRWWTAPNPRHARCSSFARRIDSVELGGVALRALETRLRSADESPTYG